MNASRPSLAALLLAAVLVNAPASAAPREMERFDASTWSRLKQSPEPSAVVFTTTDCVHCPGAIDRLSREIARRGMKASIVAVVMDPVDSGDDALLHDVHYRQVDRLFVFAGQAASLRYGVDPRWRGVTPYIVLLGPGTAPLMRAGPPAQELLDAWAPPAK